MKRVGYFYWLLPVIMAGGVMVSSCASQGSPLRSRREYDYVLPPDLLATPTPAPAPTPTPVPTPTPAPAPTPAPEMEEADDSAKEETNRRGFFSRLFRGGGDSEADGPRAGATEEETVDAPPGGGVVEVPEEEEAGGEESNGLALEDVPARYTLKIGDTIYITLSGSGGLSEQLETVVDEQGDVKLRYIGAVRAAGRSPTELEREIEAEYTERQKIYKDVVARVVVPNTSYFIGGEVRQPGRFPLVGQVTLSQAIVAAGNFTEWANPRRITLFRDNRKIEIDYREITKDPNLDVRLQPGDRIDVDRSTF